MARARDMDIGMEPVMDMFGDVDLSIDSDDQAEDVPVTPPGRPEPAAEISSTDSDDPGKPASGSELEPQFW
eukprot:8415709-Karenia_brevis.AAC.1